MDPLLARPLIALLVGLALILAGLILDGPALLIDLIRHRD
jgi:hypothetical protein